MTHKRLNQAFFIFETINTSYQNPGKFTGNLNNLLQALRNITFILQAEKSKINDFENWYVPYREEMRNDEMMRWLVKSRNYVVKEGDLEKKSQLVLRVKDHFDHDIFSTEFNPLVSLEEAARLFGGQLKIDLPKVYKEEIIVELERKWVVPEFPNAEIIDILIYCTAILTQLIGGAHSICGVDLFKCHENTFLEKDIDFMIVLRNKLKQHRIIKMAYKDGTIMKPETTELPIQDEKLNEAKRRYGSIPEGMQSLFKANKNDLPFSLMAYHSAMAKHLFEIDKQLAPAAFLYFPDKPPTILAFKLSEPQDRYYMGEAIADKVEETHCKAIILVGEVWVGSAPKEGEFPTPPRLQVDKQEQISILAASPEKTLVNFIDIKRDDKGNVHCGTESGPQKIKAPVLSRVYRIWEYQP